VNAMKRLLWPQSSLPRRSLLKAKSER
jgi:hypothetical protein